jgi:two-component system cell cycle sensor histidine kinase/response regulator CckA
VRLSVADEGSGIAPDVLPHIFEPFFTTKAAGKGTGLGLSACHGIVQAANVSSTLGKGTTFTIYLPLLLTHMPETAPIRSRHSPGGTERILLVEDEKPLQRIFVRSLADLGYGVRAASSAEEALQLLERESFALLLSDVMLPGMHGTELVKRAHLKWPTMRALLMSGYAGATERPSGVSLLAKPFTLERLATRVRAVLDGGDTTSAQPHAAEPG